MRNLENKRRWDRENKARLRTDPKHAEILRERDRIYYLNNKDVRKRYYKRNRGRCIKKSLEYQKIHGKVEKYEQHQKKAAEKRKQDRINLTDAYIIELITRQRRKRNKLDARITKEFIAVYRELVILKRELKKHDKK